jgi:hypothetical protein
MPNQALTVRISPGSHRLLRQLAEEEDSSMQAILDAAIERYRRERFLRGANADYSALKRDPNAWKKVKDERRVWEGANMDGLDAKE